MYVLVRKNELSITRYAATENRMNFSYWYVITAELAGKKQGASGTVQCYYCYYIFNRLAIRRCAAGASYDCVLSVRAFVQTMSYY